MKSSTRAPGEPRARLGWRRGAGRATVRVLLRVGPAGVDEQEVRGDVSRWTLAAPDRSPWGSHTRACARAEPARCSANPSEIVTSAAARRNSRPSRNASGSRRTLVVRPDGRWAHRVAKLGHPWQPCSVRQRSKPPDGRLATATWSRRSRLDAPSRAPPRHGRL